jgi:Tol biopolymer transport system component
MQGNFDVWLIEVTRGTVSRFTSDRATDAAPLWSPDGRRVIFRSDRNGKFDLFEKPANGSSDEEPLLMTGQDKQSLDWSSDGRFLLYATQDPKTGSDLWALPLEGERKPFAVAQTGFEETQGQFSPDGHWIAYASNETGRYEIYVRPFPDAGGKWQLSTAGGIYPRWRPDGRELFYVAPDNGLVGVPLQVAAATRTVTPGAPVALFQTRLATGGNTGVSGYAARPQYAVAADGRFLMNVTAEDTVTSPITIAQNWMAGLSDRGTHFKP